MLKRALSMMVGTILLLMPLSTALADTASIIIEQAVVSKDRLTVCFKLPAGWHMGEVNSDKISASLGSIALDPLECLPIVESAQPIAYLFLIDTSSSVSKKTRDCLTDVASIIMNGAPVNNQYAIMTFGSTIRTVQEFTSLHYKITDALNSLAYEDKSTRLYEGIENAVKTLLKATDIPALKRIILMTDGKEDNNHSVTFDDISAVLTEAHYAFYCINVDKLTADSTDNAQILRQIAEITQGGYSHINNEDATEIGEHILASSNDGIVVSFSIPSAAFDKSELFLSVRDTKGNTATGTWIVYKAGTAGPEVASEDTQETGTDQPAQTSDVAEALKFHSKQWLIVLAAVVAAIIILITIIAKASRNKKRKSHLERMGVQAVAKSHIQSKALAVTLTRRNGIGEQQYKGVIDTHVPLLIGRDASVCSIVITQDGGISGAHCKLTFADGQVHLTDCNSKNGTFINGLPVDSKRTLSSGDVLSFGNSEYEISFQKM